MKLIDIKNNVFHHPKASVFKLILFFTVIWPLSSPSSLLAQGTKWEEKEVLDQDVKKLIKEGLESKQNWKKKTSRMKIAKKHLGYSTKKKEENPERFIFLCNYNSNVIIS